MTQEEIQKQIEAVRGLRATIELFESDYKRRKGFFCSPKEAERAGSLLKRLNKDLKELTATLKPHLGEGQKLEV